MRLLSERAYQRVKDLLIARMSEVKIIAEELLKKEVLYKDDLEHLIGKRPFEEVSIHDDAIIEVLTETSAPIKEGDNQANA